MLLFATNQYSINTTGRNTAKSIELKNMVIVYIFTKSEYSLCVKVEKMASISYSQDTTIALFCQN